MSSWRLLARRGLLEAHWSIRAARAHRAPLHRVARRALHLRRAGWNVGDAALLGLLDPRQGPAREQWAVRRGEMLEYQKAINPRDASAVLEDKTRFAAACRAADIPTPRVVVTLERQAATKGTARAWSLLLSRHAPQDMVVKPATGELGVGVRVLRRTPSGVEDHAGRITTWGRLGRELAQAPHDAYVVQERLWPHRDLARLSGTDVLQCLRIVTLMGSGRQASVLYAALRISASDLPIDAFRARRSSSTGNLVARVGEDGRLAAALRVGQRGVGLVRARTHPRTGEVIDGAFAPGWEGARALALRAAAAFPRVRTVGWDVAPTDAGAVLIEGNAWWGATADPDGALLPVRDDLRAAAKGA